jgi:hypothetical protein
VTGFALVAIAPGYILQSGVDVGFEHVIAIYVGVRRTRGVQKFDV